MVGIAVTGGAVHPADNFRLVGGLLTLRMAGETTLRHLVHPMFRLKLVFRCIVQYSGGKTGHIRHHAGTALGSFGTERFFTGLLGPAGNGDVTER